MDNQKSRTLEPEERSLTFLEALGSTFAAAFGVQSKANKVRDFTHGKFIHYLISGLSACAYRDHYPNSCRRVVLSLVAALLLVTGCGQLAPASQKPALIAADDIGAAQAWGAAKNVVQVKHLYFSEQPDAIGLAQAKAAGVDLVINLRAPEEMTWDEGDAAAQAGLKYYQVPVAGNHPSFDRAALSRISDLVKANQDKKIWLHCSSGNRASAWLAVHLVQDHGMSIDQALRRARQVGLTKTELEDRVRTYLADQ